VDSNSDIALMKEIFFVSDIHAGIHRDSQDAAKLKDFQKLLGRASEEASELILLGDIFDFWYEWKHVIPAKLFPWLAALKQVTSTGLAVSIYPGNHDFRLVGFLESEIGLKVRPELDRRQLLGSKFVLHHGDGLDPKEWPYLLMKRILRSSIADKLFSLLHSDLGMWLAHQASKQDKMMRWSPMEVADSLERSLKVLLTKEDEFMVQGHVHQACRLLFSECKVTTLPAFTLPSRGFVRFDGCQMHFDFLRPEADGSQVINLKNIGDTHV
jgi:UDP-2,3-diacylglucosamine hydrolase